MNLKVVALLTDFGTRDPYVAEMKAVILTRCPQVRIVDISHEIRKFDIREGAFTLASAAPYFPEGTVHIAVVDPGVGTKRRPIVVETSKSIYVGPDNGVVMLAASKDEVRRVVVIERPSYMLSAVSRTFHGRDVFAPAAASLANGCAASSFGREIRDYVVPSFVEPTVKAGAVLGEILHVDSFGNIISSVPVELLKEELAVCEGGEVEIAVGENILGLRLCSAYGDVPVGEPLAITGSHSLLEISVNQRSAAARFKVKVGDEVSVRRGS